MKFKILFVTVISILGAACGGSSAPDTDTTAPTVSSVTPANEATGVAKTSTVTATFDEDMLSTSIDGTSFTLANSSSTAGTVTFDGSRVVTFTPTNNLALMSTYTATLSTGNTDLSGNALASDYVWSFTTADGTWGTAELIETDNGGYANHPQIAFDSSDNAIAVWYQRDGKDPDVDDIWFNRFDGISGEWETAKKIEDNSIEAYQPQIAFDSSGNAIAVWHQDDGAAWHEDDGIWASRFNGTSGEWEAAVKIDTARDPGSASFPQIAFDGNGNAIAVWQQDDGTGSNKDIWASRFNGTSGEWEPAKQIGDGDARHPQIAFDSSGNATAVWLQYNDSDPDPHERLWANRFDGASGEWETAGTIDEDDAGDAQHPQIVFDSSGNAIVVVWSQYYGTYNRIWFNRFDGGTSGEWEDAVKIDKDRDSGQHAQHPQIAFDSNGNAIAVWQQDDGNSTGHNDIWANRFDGTTGKWGDTAGLIEDNSGTANQPQIAFDSSGNAIAVWYQFDGTYNNIWFNRFDGTSWGTAEKIEDNDGSAFWPQIAFDSSGNAIAVWSQDDGTSTGNNDIWANRFE